MSKLLSVLAAGLLFVSSAAVAAESASGIEKPGAMASELITLTATVEAIDLEKRLVTLKGPEGNTVTLKVDEQARNLDQVKVGDQVQAEYLQSVALYAQKPDGSLPAAAEIAAIERAPAGEKPGMAAIDSRMITATVESIDLEKRTVALKGPEGNTLNLKVDERTPNLENLKAGDQVVARYTQAIAISVNASTSK
jgi:Cu/Ag efflux protein CusF